VADSDRNSPARLALLGDLRRGLDRGELELHFQPKVLLENGQAAGMEALVRWQHPVRGLMTPEEFIPLVEQSYLMRDLTFQVVDRALAQASIWWRDGLAVQVSLNVAARDLLDVGLADTIRSALKRHGLPPEALLLEINERVLTSEPAHAAATVEAVAALGVALSLDDFGTGYSSLVRLKRLPVSEVKIDSSFVGRLLGSADDEVIVQSIVDLVRALGIDSVAEGVESAEVAAALRVMGCKSAQGWYFSKPLNAASATVWLAEHGVTGPQQLAARRAAGGQARAAGAARAAGTVAAVPVAAVPVAAVPVAAAPAAAAPAAAAPAVPAPAVPAPVAPARPTA
jgi:EAL domain-containing protein (putative c-di-GMP-specific phosphodiesterase class I)